MISSPDSHPEISLSLKEYPKIETRIKQLREKLVLDETYTKNLQDNSISVRDQPFYSWLVDEISNLPQILQCSGDTKHWINDLVLVRIFFIITVNY